MRIPVVILTGFALSGTIHAADGRSYSDHLAADPSGDIQISDVAGSIKVTAWDKPEVDIQGQLGATVDHVEVTHTGNHIAVEVRLPKNLHFDRDNDMEARLQIRVPVNSTLSVSTVSAPITLDGPRGAAHLHSVSGDIYTTAGLSAVDAHSVSGTLYLASGGAPGGTHASTVSGNTFLTHAGGDIAVSTINGALNLTLEEAKSVDVSSVSGSVDLHGTLSREARLGATTVDGRLSVKVAAEAGYRYDIATFNGSVHNCFGGQPADAQAEHARGASTGTTGAGTASLRLRTLNGEIDLCDR